MFLGMLFLSIFGNGVCYHNKNKQVNKRLAEMRKRGAGMWTIDKDGNRKFIPM